MRDAGVDRLIGKKSMALYMLYGSWIKYQTSSEKELEHEIHGYGRQKVVLLFVYK